MSRYFEITFNDLDSEKKEELIQEVALQLKDKWKEVAEEKNDTDRTWQDICCELFAFDDDLRDTDYTNWDFTVDNHAEESAEEILNRAFKDLEIEVEV